MPLLQDILSQSMRNQKRPGLGGFYGQNIDQFGNEIGLSSGYADQIKKALDEKFANQLAMSTQSANESAIAGGDFNPELSKYYATQGARQAQQGANIQGLQAGRSDELNRVNLMNQAFQSKLGQENLDLQRKMYQDSQDFDIGDILGFASSFVPLLLEGGGEVTSDKAKKILTDGSVKGHPLTDAQKRYFGWIAGGKKPRKMAGGGQVADKAETNPYSDELYQAQLKRDVYRKLLGYQMHNTGTLTNDAMLKERTALDNWENAKEKANQWREDYEKRNRKPFANHLTDYSDMTKAVPAYAKGGHIGFKNLEEMLKAKGATNPGGLAHYIGVKKYGKAGFKALQHKADGGEINSSDYFQAMYDGGIPSNEINSAPETTGDNTLIKAKTGEVIQSLPAVNLVGGDNLKLINEAGQMANSIFGNTGDMLANYTKQPNKGQQLGGAIAPLAGKFADFVGGLFGGNKQGGGTGGGAYRAMADGGMAGGDPKQAWLDAKGQYDALLTEYEQQLNNAPDTNTKQQVANAYKPKLDTARQNVEGLYQAFVNSQSNVQGGQEVPQGQQQQQPAKQKIIIEKTGI